MHRGVHAVQNVSMPIAVEVVFNCAKLRLVLMFPVLRNDL